MSLRSLKSASFVAMAVLCGAASPLFADIAMPRIMSHRGESNDRPENTMAACRLAVERGVEGVECDVYCTSDGVPVIIHDSTTGRTAGSGTNLTVTASSWNDLKDVRVGAFGSWIGTAYEGETIPKLEDYLALLASNSTTRCIIELKGNGANNLVANVVAAVQAQPLATADRVVFIAFTHSLIREIRTALPDYEAWLLYSGSSYTGAGLISDIQTYNATGVDVVYTANFSAEDVAAVKAAGYAFAVWTCDNDAQAFALAEKGVDEITTNRGGAMKTALAALIAEADSHREINEPNFPAGITLMEPSAYVQTGLVGNFDGIRNAGANLPHDFTTRTWKNLISSGPDAKFYYKNAETTEGNWTVNGFYFNNNVCARLVSNLSLGTYPTVEFVTTVNINDQTYGSNKNYFKVLFHQGTTGDNPSLFINNNGGSRTDTVYLKADNYADSNNTTSPRPSLASWQGKYLAFILGDGRNYMTQTTELGSGSNRNKTSAINSMQFSWGGVPYNDNNSQNRNVKGTYHAVRMYTRALNADELKWNRVVDEVRFRGVVTNGTVFVASNRVGAEGTEASGQYYVNGNHTFTAPATVTIDGCVYEQAGYKLETYNPTKKTWDVVGEYDGASFAYTNCLANTGVRITWNWHLKSGVKKIDADDYVQGGLLLGFDGIRNAGLGVAHDDSATTWKNLGTGPDATLITFTAANGSGAWKADGYDFTAGSCFETLSSLVLARQASIQFATEYNASRQKVRWPSFFSAALDSDRFLSYTYSPLDSGNRGDHLRFNSSPLTGLSFGVDKWNGRHATLILDYNRASNSDTAHYAWQTGTYKADVGTYKYGIGAGRSSASHRADRAYSGLYHAFRLYDRVLTEAEIARNLEIDDVRFYAGASRSTDTNIVEVAVESPGGVVTVDEAGSWIVRGENASKTFTAPATVTVGNNTYSCTGYRLETWNATKRMWESPVETVSATTANLSSANTNRRLTWLYALTAGIRAAADYDVGDYVQKGLVANYDGIRNFGPKCPHGTLSQYWLDSSYRDVQMVGASNSTLSAWIGLGHHFTAAEDNFFEMTEPIALGQEMTVQSVLNVTASQQTKSYPCYVGFGFEDRSFFTRGKGTTMEVKLDDWVGPRTTLANWGGKYFTYALDSSKIYMTQGTEYGTGTARTKYSDMPNNKFAIGAPSSYPNNFGARDARAMTGDYYALRIYNRKLTEAELAHNMTVDEIRYHGNFTNANVTVVCEVPFEGVEAPVAIPSGDYEVTGSFTFTASGLTVGESTFPARYTIETWDGSAWGAPVEYESASYTYTAGGAKVRLTWKWADPTVPVKATWTGGGDVGNLLDPNNWNCVNASGETIVAAPTNVTTVVISGTTAFTIPDGVTTFPWKEIRFGAETHTATRLGSLGLNSNAGFAQMGAGHFTLKAASDANLSKLNGGNNGPNATWQSTYLTTKRARFDGWINVSAAQSGTWEIKQGFDDYFGFALDGEWLIVNNTYVLQGSATVDVSEGWHRFTIVCGDTSGGYGSTDSTGIIVNGEHVPLAITAGGNIFSLTSGGFAFGAETPGTITLSADCDWSALGNALVVDGTTIDLNGHNLDLASISSDFVGTKITNSNDSVQSTITFTAPEGASVTNGVAICGNVKVVKKGLGTYLAYAAECNYSGGTYIDEGTAQPPDGSDSATTYSYDSFKAFGLGEIVVASGATFDFRANYAYRSHVVLNGGTLTNTKENMTKTGWDGSGIGRLEADSTNRVPCSIVFGDNNGNGNMDLNGHTLTVLVGSARRFYLRCAKIENGKMDFAAGDGWFQVVNACTATNVDFRVNSALSVGAALSVRDYEAVWSSNTKTHNEGTAALNVYGTFTPAAGQKFYGCTMQNGSTIDLSGRTGTFSTLSYYTGGSTNIKFAANANVTINLAGRTDLRTIVKSENPFVVTWPEGLGPAASVTFQVDAETKQNRFKIVRDDERNGLRLVRASGFTLIVQ